MKIIIDISTEEAKDLLTPGPNQIKMFNEIGKSFTTSWVDVITEAQKNVWNWQKTK